MLLEKASTDWLCTKPVFYNENTGAISYDMRDVIDYKNLRFNGEGLSNYLKFGYTAFGQTMVDGVRSLDHSSHIVRNEDGSLTITKEEDIAEKLWNPGQMNSGTVFEEIIESTRSWADKLETSDDKTSKLGIVLPLSGGLDSRLLAYSLGGRRDVFAYSYGLSAKQSESFEAVKAGMVAKECDIPFKQIDIYDFLREDYLDRWYKLYGPTVHFHGMYQMNFYDGVMNDLHGQEYSNYYLLSGIIGDGWSGNVYIPEINSAEDMALLGYTHGMNGNEKACLIPITSGNAQEFWEKNKDKLQDENWRILYAMRFKMQLLHYLLKTPESMGMKSWSPFIDPKISMDMLNLDWSEKKDRLWQKREFEKLKLNIGWEKDKCDYNMVLNVENVLNHRPRPLDVKLLSQVVNPSYVESVNRNIMASGFRAISARPRTIGNMYNKLAKRVNAKIDRALVDYRMLGSIERLLLDAENS